MTYSQGADFKKNESYLEDAIKAAENSDLIILTIGEDTYTETFGNIDNPYLSKSQKQLADAMIATEKQFVVVYIGNKNH